MPYICSATFCLRRLEENPATAQTKTRCLDSHFKVGPTNLQKAQYHLERFPPMNLPKHLLRRNAVRWFSPLLVAFLLTPPAFSTGVIAGRVWRMSQKNGQQARIYEPVQVMLGASFQLFCTTNSMPNFRATGNIFCILPY